MGPMFRYFLSESDLLERHFPVSPPPHYLHVSVVLQGFQNSIIGRDPQIENFGTGL